MQAREVPGHFGVGKEEGSQTESGGLEAREEAGETVLKRRAKTDSGEEGWGE